MFFIHTCVQFIFFVYLCSVKLMLTKMKRLCIIALFAALVMGCANTPKAYPDLKFMSFNIRLGSQWAENEDGSNGWSQRKEAVVAMILKEAPDAIGMQEVLPHQFLYLDSALSGMYKGIGVGRDNGLPATDTACDGEIMCIFYRTDRLELLNQESGVWSCTFVGYCSQVCPKGVDPASAIQLSKIHSTTDYIISKITPGAD